MLKHNLWRVGAISLLALSLTTCKKQDHCNENGPAKVTVFATGLNNPRGLKFGPDGNLYVAEAGIGGTDSTVGQCQQVPPPIGPILGSTTGSRISMITRAGVRTTVTDQLPSATNAIGERFGVADVAFIGHTLYALITGAGCSHGVPSIPNGVIRVESNNTWTQVANLSQFMEANPVENPNPGDFEPDGDWYSMINVDNNVYAIEANQGQLVKVAPSNGDVNRIVDFSADLGHIVPTVVAYRDGYFYVGNLNPFPVVEGSSKIWRVSRTGQVQEWASGFTTILGLTFDRNGHLYVLETSVGAPFPSPGLGRIVKVDHAGINKQVVVTGLSLPTGLTYGPDGHLYVSNVGFGPTGVGGGQVLKVTLNHCDRDDEHDKVAAKG